MLNLLLTDFIKNRTILLVAALGILLDGLLFQTINHTLILFALPYLTSIILEYLMKPSCSIKPLTRISEQYKPKSHHKIKIIPR
jgi:hypothetical protein